MEKGVKVRVLLGLAGIGAILTNWTLNMLQDPTPVTNGRVSMVLILYGVVLAYALWKMFRPNNVNLPEFKETNLSSKRDEAPIFGDYHKSAVTGMEYGVRPGGKLFYQRDKSHEK